MKKIVLLIALLAFAVVPLLADAAPTVLGINRTRTSVIINVVTMTPGTANTCEIGYYYGSGSYETAVVVKQPGSEALCESLVTALLNNDAITSTSMVIFDSYYSTINEVVNYLSTNW